jgi:hypothetical protein
MLFLGVDRGEAHHDLCLLNQDGRVLAARRVVDGLAGVEELHSLVAAQAEQPGQVAVGIEPPGPSRTAGMPRCWPIWSAPTGTTTARSPVTPQQWRRSRCWPGPIRA